MLDILGKLFGSVVKVKIMRLFLLSEDSGFDLNDLKERIGTDGKTISEELRRLEKIGFILKKSIKKDFVQRNNKIITKRVSGYVFNQNFKYKESLYNLLIDTEFIDPKEILNKFRKAGKVKLVLFSGVFVKNIESPIDVLVVGDNLSQPIVEKNIKLLESEIGKELTYAFFETNEFLYRASMYDKLVREIIDTPFMKIIDVGILEQIPKITRKATYESY